MGNTETGTRYSPSSRLLSPEPARFVSAASRIASSVPAMDIQNRFESALIARRRASAGSVRGLMPA